MYIHIYNRYGKQVFPREIPFIFLFKGPRGFDLWVFFILGHIYFSQKGWCFQNTFDLFYMYIVYVILIKKPNYGY